MKFNWGWGILIVVVLFIGFILNLVYRCSLQRVDLVSEKYYEREIKFQDQIDREKNTAGLKDSVRIIQAGKEIRLTYPSSVPTGSLSGEITFFKPDDARQDFSVKVQPDSGLVQRVDASLMSHGWWRVQVTWTSLGKPYYSEEKIHID
jgi:nitrogen fixation protein FixH